MKLLIAVSALALASASMAAQADDISYSYVDAAYVRVNFDDISEDADGFGIRGSVEVTDSVFVFASYADVSLSVGGFSADEQDYAVGVGYGWAVSDTVNVYGKVAYVRAEAGALGFSLDDDGYSLAIGVRTRLTDRIELEGAVTYVDFGDLGDDTGLGIGARYYFTEQFAVGLEASFSDDSSVYGAGVRWQWGK